MKLFCLLFDGDFEYVEAASMQDAIAIWRKHMMADHDLDGTDEPESCALVHDEAVLR